MRQYNFRQIEKKWQKFWRDKKIYEPDLKNAKKPFYNLMMFPYPSAEGLHVGNMYAFTGADIYGRMKRMQGYDVFEPIGLDGFGIHSENYALKIGAHPMKQAKISEKRFYKQLEAIGNGFAWDEKLETYDPEYYKWTQWIFIQLFKRGLAYRKKAPVNWCPSCKTVLADEQVIAGRCERCGSVAEKKELEQWFFRITKYADKLLENLEKIDWSERVKIAQRNWIGKSEGALIDFEIKTGEKLNFVLLHGYLGSPERNFFPWLKKELENRGHKVFAPALPEPDNPRLVEQVETVIKKASFDKNTVLLGHSLGGVVALKTLERITKPIRRTILVASFARYELLDPFDKQVFDWRFDVKKVRKNAGDLIIMRDLTDDVVPKNQAEELLKLFGGKIVDFKASEPHVVGDVEPGVLRQCIPAIEVFTTRPDTIFGATYLVLAPEHQLIQNLESSIKNLTEVKKYIARAKKKTEEKRIAEGREKTGVELKGIKAVNPANKKEIPVWVADYVLGSYGTGAIMAVPTHDERDREFAEKFNLPVSDAPLVNAEEILPKIGGKRKVQYRLRDWLISRQRYWGPPIPMIFCENCKKSMENPKFEIRNSKLSDGELENPGWVPVPEKDLPVKLPFVKDFRPKGKGVSPLASVKSFYEVMCPRCGGPARRETDVSDTFLDSAWYYLRYPSVKEKNAPWNKEITKKWFPVNLYIGGAEHAVLHLLYVRFLALALHDLGLLEFGDGDSPAPKGEPFPRFRAHGLLIKEGAKMSKSKGNVVNPDDYIKKFGADTLRMYLMFLAPFEQGGDFRDAGVLGISRFLERVWKLYQTLRKGFKKSKEKIQTQPIDKSFHRTIKKVTEDVENLRYNTAISALMILLNEMEKEKSLLSFDHGILFLKLLAPFAPHIAEEIWRAVLGCKNSIHLSDWPGYDPKLIEEETAPLIVQINGRVKAVLSVPKGIGREEAEKIARASAAVKKILEGKKVARIIFVKDKLINFVI